MAVRSRAATVGTAAASMLGTENDKLRAENDKMRAETDEARDEARKNRARLARLATKLECPICLEQYNDPMRLSGCGHTFCNECITKHVQGRAEYSQRCPLCKQPARKRDCMKAQDICSLLELV